MPGETEFHARLRTLRTRFVLRLQADVAAIDELLATSPDGLSAEGLSRLRDIAHALRGTAGSFGFPEAACAAAKLEDEAVHALDKGTMAKRNETVTRLRLLSSDLRRSALEAARHRGSSSHGD